MICKNYNLEPEKLGKIPQRIYDDLLDNIGSILSYENTGEVNDKNIGDKKDKDNVKWMKERKLLKDDNG